MHTLNEIESEVWLDIPGFEGKYQVSDQGRVRSLDRLVRGKHRSGTEFQRLSPGKVLTPAVYCKTGHLSLPLGRLTNGIPVHQLVLLAFQGPCPDGQEVRHKNGNPKDNRLINLEYGTRTENILDVYHQGKKWRKLSAADVHDIRSKLAAGVTGASLAREYKVTDQSISRIKRGETFKWLKNLT